MTIERIRIPSASVHNGQPRYETAEFALGPGPCGKTVTHLDVTRHDDNSHTVSQACSDGTHQHFFYPASTITGRVERHCKTVNEPKTHWAQGYDR